MHYTIYELSWMVSARNLENIFEASRVRNRVKVMVRVRVWVRAWVKACIRVWYRV